VVLLDQRTPGGGASRTNAGWISPGHSAPVPGPRMLTQAIRWMAHRDSPLYIRPSLAPDHVAFLLRMARFCNQRAYSRGLEAMLTLGTNAVGAFDELALDGVQPEVHRSGILMAFRSEEAGRGLLREAEEGARIGHGGRLLDAAEARELEPLLSDAVIGAVWCPSERHLVPDTLIDALADRCQALGVEIHSATAVTGFSHSAGTVTAVRTSQGPIRCDAVLLSAGAWTGHVARLLGKRLPIRPGKGYGVDCSPAPVPLRHALLFSEDRVAVSPVSYGIRLAGTMEFAGFDEGIDRVRSNAILASARRYLRDWPAAASLQPRRWSGLRPMTPDGLPVIGKFEAFDNVVVAAGHGMLGITLGPVTANHVANIFRVGEAPEALAPFAPDRFAARSRRS
jgi:D-amino-acid dehydrogenase